MKKIKYTGFSLLEMIIVVVVVGVLLAGITKMFSAVDTTKITSTVTNIPKIKNAIDKLMTNQGIFSYKLLKSKYKNKDNVILASALFNYAGVSSLKNPFGKTYSISINKENLIIKTKLPNKNICLKAKKMIVNRNISNNVSCDNKGNLSVTFTSGN